MSKITIIFAVLALTLSAQAQPLPKDKAVREGRLPNGLTYFIRHNAKTPGQADFYIANCVGSILEEPEQRGLAHFLEHMAFNGTEHFPDGNEGKNSIRNWCERNGIKFGADLNASTSVERTLFNISNAPIAKTGVTDTCLLILRDWCCSLLLNDSEIDHERGVIHEEWRNRRSQKAVQRLVEDAIPVMYQGSKYADCLPIGNINVVDTFKHDQLRRFYKKWYRPELQAIIVVGDVDVDDVEQKIKTRFSDIPASAADAAERTYYSVPDNQSTISYIVADDEQPTINFTIYMKRNSLPRSQRASRQAFIDDYKSRLAMFILRQRLSELTIAENPKVISVSCRDGGFYITDEKDAFTLNIGLRPDNIESGINEVFAIVEKARRFGFTESELEHAKMQHNVNLEHRVDNKDNTTNSEYVGKIINHFCNATHLMSIDDEADIEHSLMESVTLDEVNAALRDIVLSPESTSPSNRVILVYGPTKWDGKPYVMPSGRQFEQWVANAEQTNYDNDKEYKAVDRTFIKKMPKKGKIVAKRSFAYGYTEYTLSNGIKVYGRASTIEPNRLTIKMFRAGGQSLYPDSDLPSLQMLQNVVRTSGASDFDLLTLEKKRAGKALRVVPYIDQEEEGVRGVCAASDFKTWLQIAYLYITEPRRDDRIFNSLVERQRSILKNRGASPQVVFNDSVRYSVYSNAHRSNPLTLERLDSVSVERIYQIYNERFANMAGMNLVVTGDIRTDEFEELICQYVASLPGKVSKKYSPHCGEYILDMRRGTYSKVFEYKQKTPSALTNIFYSYTGKSDVYTADNDLKADVLAQILKSVYLETMRESEGGTYGVSVSSQGWREPNEGIALTVEFRCAPSKFSQLLPIVDRQIKLIAKNGPSEEQLEKIKEYELKNYQRAIDTNGWWEYLCYNYLTNGIDFDDNYVGRVKSLTCDDIRDFCRILLSQNNRIQVTMKQ